MDATAHLQVAKLHSEHFESTRKTILWSKLLEMYPVRRQAVIDAKAKVRIKGLNILVQIYILQRRISAKELLEHPGSHDDT